MGISSGPTTLKFWQSAHFQNRDFEKGKFFSPERRSKGAKFAKNDRLDALILLAKDEQFLFFPWKMIQRGDHWRNFSILCCIKPCNFASFLEWPFFYVRLTLYFLWNFILGPILFWKKISSNFHYLCLISYFEAQNIFRPNIFRTSNSFSQYLFCQNLFWK